MEDKFKQEREQLVTDLVAQTMTDLEREPRPKSSRRAWENPRGYRFLVPWSNAVLLRILVRALTADLPRKEYRMKAQVDDAARSSVANIEEGFKRATTGEYIRFLSFSQGSLEEVKGDIERLFQDGYLQSVPGSKLTDLGIDLKAWNEWAKNPLNSSKIFYFPLKDNRGSYRILKEIKGKKLTYEILTELINKTDYLLRGLVKSLETKIQNAKLQ